MTTPQTNANMRGKLENQMAYPNHLIDYEADPEQLLKLRKALSEAKLDYMITNRDGALVQLNVWVGKIND